MPRLALLLLLLVLCAPAAAVAQEDVTVERGLRFGAAKAIGGKRQKLLLDLYRPATAAPGRPAIVVAFGGGFVAGSREAMQFLAERYAEAGYLAVAIDYRTVTEEYIRRHGYEKPARMARADTLAAVRWLRRHRSRLDVNPRRLFISGDSAGGNTALAAGYGWRTPGRSGNRGFSSRVSGTIAWAGFAGDAAVTGDGAPALIFGGAKDELIRPEYIRRTCRVARQRGATCRAIIYDDAGHDVGYVHFEAVVERSLRWMAARPDVR